MSNEIMNFAVLLQISAFLLSQTIGDSEILYAYRR